MDRKMFGDTKSQNKNVRLKPSLQTIILLVLVYLCVFKTDYKNNPKDIPFLTIGLVSILFPPIRYAVQKIQLYLIKMRFNNDEYVICESVLNFPWHYSYWLIIIFGGYFGSVLSVLLHHEIHYRRISVDNIWFHIIVVVVMMYFIYYFLLRTKTILTNYGLRSNHRYDTLFDNIEKIEKENKNKIFILKIYKKHSNAIRYNKIPKIYRPDNKEKDYMYFFSKNKYEMIKTLLSEGFSAYKGKLMGAEK